MQFVMMARDGERFRGLTTWETMSGTVSVFPLIQFRHL